MAFARSTKARFLEMAGSSPWVDALWRCDAGEALTEMIPADGSVDLIVRASADGSISSLVHAPSACAHEACIGVDELVVGVRIRVGFGAPLLTRAESVKQLAIERTRSGIDLRVLEAVVSESLDSVGRPPGLVHEFLEFARECAGTARLGGGRRPLASERALQRAARQWIGVTPKGIMRIERVRAARRSIREGQPPAHVAAELGYADQAHLTREFREILGVTPGEMSSVGNLQDRDGYGG